MSSKPPCCDRSDIEHSTSSREYKACGQKSPTPVGKYQQPPAADTSWEFFRTKKSKTPSRSKIPDPRSQIPEETDHLTSFATLDTSAGMKRWNVMNVSMTSNLKLLLTTFLFVVALSKPSRWSSKKLFANCWLRETTLSTKSILTNSADYWSKIIVMCILVKQSGRQLLFLAVTLLLVTQVSSFSFKSFNKVMIPSLQSKLTIRQTSREIIQMRSMFNVSPLKSTITQINEIKPKRAVPFWNIANILTISRVLAIPFFMLSFVMRRVSLTLFLLS